jgi:hypothetical protein
MMMEQLTMKQIEERHGKSVKNDINNKKRHLKAKTKIYQWKGQVGRFERTYLIYETEDDLIVFYNVNEYAADVIPKEMIKGFLNIEF